MPISTRKHSLEWYFANFHSWIWMIRIWLISSSKDHASLANPTGNVILFVDLKFHRSFFFQFLDGHLLSSKREKRNKKKRKKIVQGVLFWDSKVETCRDFWLIPKFLTQTVRRSVHQLLQAVWSAEWYGLVIIGTNGLFPVKFANRRIQRFGDTARWRVHSKGVDRISTSDGSLRFFLIRPHAVILIAKIVFLISKLQI